MNNTTDNTSHYQPVQICDYPNCIDRGVNCANCEHNRNKSHYKPVVPYPWHPQVWLI